MARRPWLTLLALIVAPSAATVIVSFIAGLYFALTRPTDAVDLEEIFGGALAIAPFGVFLGGYIAIPASLTLGWIVHAGLRAQQITDLRSYVLCALFAGLLIVLLARLLLPFYIVLWGLPVAALSGALLWSIRRPDRDMANLATRTT